MKIPIIQIEDYHWLYLPCPETIPSSEVIVHRDSCLFRASLLGKYA